MQVVDSMDASCKGRCFGIRSPPLLYYVETPPRYVRDLRTGEPGQWVVRQPSIFEHLFGLPRDGY
jgi:hypothetical protein